MTEQSPALLLLEYLIALPSGVLDGFCDTFGSYGRGIFRDALPVQLSGTGKRALVLSNQPQGSYGRVHVHGQTVAIRCYSDHTRVGTEAPVEDGTDRCWAMIGLVDQLVDDPKPLFRDDPFVQVDRTTNPLETWDPAQNVPYVVINYDVAVMVTP